MTSVMASVKELAVQMSSDYYEVQGMSDSATEATAHLESLIQLGNTSLAGRYVFAGASYDSEAYDDTGTYQGDNLEPEIPVGDGWEVLGGFDGSRLLQGTTDIFQVVNDLVTALGSGDSDNVADLLDDIDAATDQLIAAQTEIGAEMLKVEDALELSSSLAVELQLTLAGFTEADQVESYALLMKYQTAYEAALQVTASSQVGNLFNKI
jgi:flagellar hook-associated protein 3 FlgL